MAERRDSKTFSIASAGRADSHRRDRSTVRRGVLALQIALAP